MEELNIIQIEEKIKENLSSINTPTELVALQKWAKKAKKQKVVQPTVTSFKQMNYTWESTQRSSGSGKYIGKKVNKVDYTSFIFLGLEVVLPSENRYYFNEEDFNSHKIWIDRTIKYGGTEYFPKQPLSEYFGIDLENMFFDYIKEKSYYIVKKNEKTYFLCNDDRNAVKLICGKRLTKFDTLNNEVVKLSKQHIDYIQSVKPLPYFNITTTNSLDKLPF